MSVKTGNSLLTKAVASVVTVICHLSSVICHLSSVICLSGTAHGAAPPRLPVLQVQAGWGGHGRVGHWLPIRITVTNVTEPIDGYLEVVRDRLLEAATPVTLTPGAPKRYTLLTILRPASPPNPATTITVRLRRGRTILARVTPPVRPLDPESRLLLALTDETAGLQAFEGQSVESVGWQVEREPEGEFGERVVRTAHLSPAEAPEVWNALEPVDLMLLTGAAWSAMNGAQRRAVRRWIECGGRAILCGERPQEWADAEGKELLPGRLGAPVASPDGIQCPIVPAADADPIMQAGPEAIVCTGPRGFGVVTWVGLDPFRATVRLSPEYRKLWSTWIRHTTGMKERARRPTSLLDTSTATEVTAALPQMPAPSRTLLGSIALVYVLVFGPLNIRVLRRLRRTVTAWLFLPALSVGMTGILLLLGSAWARGQTVLNRLVVIEAMSGAATGWEEGLAGLFSPTNRTFGVTIDDPCVGLRVASPDEGFLTAPTGQPDAGLLVPTLQTDTQSRWASLPVTLWSLHHEQYSRPLDLGGKVAISLHERVPGRPEGVVRNEMEQPLHRAYLHFRGHRQPLGDLAPGATRSVRAGDWVRRRTVQTTASASRYGQPGIPDAGPRMGEQIDTTSGRQPTVGDGRAAREAFYEDAPVLLRSGSSEDEVVLVAKLREYRPPARIDGVAEQAPLTLLLVRSVLRRR
jgi:hypothetical protein